MCTTFNAWYPWRSKEGVRSPATEVTSELPCGCWELDPGPLQVQPVLLTIEPLLLPWLWCFKNARVNVRKYACACLCTCVCGYTCVCMHYMPVCACVCMHICVYVCVHCAHTHGHSHFLSLLLCSEFLGVEFCQNCFLSIYDDKVDFKPSVGQVRRLSA